MMALVFESLENTVGKAENVVVQIESNDVGHKSSYN